MKTKKKTKKKLTAPVWIKTPIGGESLDVLRAWQLNDAAHEYTEVAILRALTPAAKTLAEDNTALRKFLNDNHNKIFRKDVNAIINRVQVPPGPACKQPFWDFIVVHGRASNAVVIEVPCFT
ncbi:MAG TPA: hypothetical protein VK829_15165 [Terriglobales bacterium]|nr:hypothetical protein [Terriglobales bacterium]